jgi:YegS/Rv2252/BmrU family lipid kinase
MKLLILFNPASANGRAGKLLPRVEGALTDRGLDYELHLTREPGHARSLVEQSRLGEFNGVVAAGGDGTMFEVINGLKTHPDSAQIPLGVLPLGTGNAFVREMGLTAKDWQLALDVIAKGQVRSVDLGVFEHQDQKLYFANVLGLGFVSDVAALAHRLKRIGNFAYTLAIFLRLAGLRSRRLLIELDGRCIERDSVFVEICNSRYTADFMIAPAARVDDGLLDIVLLKRCSRARLIRNFPKVRDGTHVTLEEVEVYQAREIRVTADIDSRLTPDGEVMGSTPVSVSCRPADLSVFWQTD